MTHDLRERLDELVADVPAYVVPDARAAWSAGARRRTRHRIGVVAGALAILALVASAVSWLPRTLDPAPADGERPGVRGYPARVDEPWLDRELPDRPGPVAGILETDDGSVRVVSATGRVWTLDQGEAIGFPLAVSADGTKLGYFEQIDRFVLRDLVTGRAEVAADVGDGSYIDGETEPWGRYWVSQQMPAYMSPAGDRVFVSGIDRDDEDVRGLLIGGGDSTRPVRSPNTPGQTAFPAGWTPGGDLVWVDGNADDRGSARWATVVITTVRGEEVRRVDLDLPGTTGALSGQWSGSVSPDGRTIALRTERFADRSATLFSLESGSVVRELPTPDDLCPISWSGSDPVTSSAQGDDDVVVRHNDGSPMIVADPALAASCGIWATDALSGEPRGMVGRLLGARQGWVAWHWQEVTLGTLALAGAALLVVRRRRTRLVPTS
ncbi:hypothetical protein GCM10023350_27450 [Nocardioides endophyticus]|uniref:WD40 repeat domain-containing protein n=1 Tax=Nocardioides endophyticus TaxID=1353775 RepID=A0ABP8YZI6_9ACTN